ncbi:MAG: sugar transferase [Ardenticatenaceae bacterium]|nr:sugar transferase [Ardenticatenaceae bacterium]
MLRQFSAKRIVTSFLVDWIGTLITLLLAATLNSGLGGIPEPIRELWNVLAGPFALENVTTGPRGTLSMQVFFFVALIWPFFFAVFGVYDGRRNETTRIELVNIFFAVSASTLALAGALFLTYRETSRALFATFFLLNLGFLLSVRVIWWLYRRVEDGPQNRTGKPVLIVGAGPVGVEAAVQLAKYAARTVHLLGFVDDDPHKQQQKIHNLSVMGTVDQLPELVLRHKVRDVIVALPPQAHARLIEIGRTLQKMGVNIHVIPDLFALSFPGAALDGFGGIPVIHLGRPGINGRRRHIKQAFDILAASLGMFFIWPILLIVSVLIKLESDGPVFYKQERVGENGRPFTMYKFRSMKVNNDDKIHREHVTRLIAENTTLKNGENSLKMKHDPRVTRIGRFIRKTSVDELPQLFNVLRGEMSLVGPRPPLPYEVEVYKEWHMQRLEALPGITGSWQVDGRNQVSFDEMVRMDIAYIERQSFWLDLWLILKTPLALFSAKGAG